MKYATLISLLALSCQLVLSQNTKNAQTDQDLITEIEKAATVNLLQKWYPLALDMEEGGFYSSITNDFKIGENQDKMIVTQARHIWTNARAARRYPENTAYLAHAKHGIEFLRDKMWDKDHGGFHNLVTRQGIPVFNDEVKKTAYGNAFAIYGLAAYYSVSGNQEALDLAKKTFFWLEDNSHDPVYKGYYQSLNIDGTPIERTNNMPTTSTVGYKDQNSSIHLLEAFTELYQVWPNELLEERLEELLIIIRDTITSDKGFMNLFFEKDWTPVSFKHTSKENIEKHYYLDHVSFGHDVETAFLMLEASHALGGNEDAPTLAKGKRMVDHALRTGWDEETGGFYDGGYYYGTEDKITIVNDHKNWWTQAEGLNSLLLFSFNFPDDPMDYRGHFKLLWNYVNRYQMDQEHGGWYEWGTDMRPDSRHGLKGHIWKATYHNYRALINCKAQLEKGPMKH